MSRLDIPLRQSPVFKTGRSRRRFRRLGRILLFGLAGLVFLGSIQAWLNRPETVELQPISQVLAQLPSTTAGSGEAGPGFIIANPYAFEGTWFKVQLHSHTNHSLDGRWSVDEALAAYREAGYDFLAISDHDRVTRPPWSPDSPLLIPAEETTISFPFWPFGHHAIVLFVDEPIKGRGIRRRLNRAREKGGLVSIAHPSWVGNLGTGRWDVSHLMVTQDFTLMEVYNPYSDTETDTAIWHETVLRRGPETPVWAVAVDDAHDLKNFNKGWTMVKAERRTLESLREALQRGSLYATTGVEVVFGVEGGHIFTAPPATGAVAGDRFNPAADHGESSHPAGRYHVRYVNARGETVHSSEGDLNTRYDPRGDEGFVRVEVVDRRNGKRSWSQPFWLIPAPAPEIPARGDATL